jgi:30S ribosomal protein S31
MGKGDKKTRRGKITIGSFGVRRRRKKISKASLKPVNAIVEKDKAVKKTVREKPEAVTTAEVKKKPVKEKAAPKTSKDSKAKKEGGETAAETKPKKEKKDSSDSNAVQ